MLVQWQSQTRALGAASSSTSTPSPNVTTTTFPPAIQEPNPQSVLKRFRPDTDVDGEDSVDAQRKKRRLRVDLVTSRLSQPFATPATHIISRKALRLGPWASPIYRVRSLRRAAILNAFRARMTTTKRLGSKEVNLLTNLKPQHESEHTEVDLITEGIRTPRDPCPQAHPPQQYQPPSPSPLGPSNYDAFDEEEDAFNSNDAEDSDGEDCIYSNFNHLDNSDTEDYDSLTPFSGGEVDEDRPWHPQTLAEADAERKDDRKAGTVAVPCSL
ncbi:MAG: hypothetical protein Q9201_001217 [Fulgogasparrea decipioides]